MKATLLTLLSVISLALHAGCFVTQPRGMGQSTRIQEPNTQAWYQLYLPVDYVQNNGQHPSSPGQKWPLVVTFHGMKPYDNARPQVLEWEEQADIYGYIVCAPELRSCNSFMEFPLTQEHDYVLEDQQNVIAIMDHVLATTDADPSRVLSTSWSCGGYLAHYFANRHPDRFACLATRLSNFSADLLVEETVPNYRDRVPVAIYIGDSDFPAVKRESQEAAAWYQARHFRIVHAKMIDHAGHLRIPHTAAAFFAEQMGIYPLNPAAAAKAVASFVMTDYFPTQEMINQMSPAASVASYSFGSDDELYVPNSSHEAPPVVSRPQQALNVELTEKYAGF